MIHPLTWQHDSASTFCLDCRRPFALLRRRHHCRHCGGLFCGDCTAQKLWLRPIFDNSVLSKQQEENVVPPRGNTSKARSREETVRANEGGNGRGTSVTRATDEAVAATTKTCAEGSQAERDAVQCNEAALPLPLKPREDKTATSATPMQPRVSIADGAAALVTHRSSTTMALTSSGTLATEDNTEMTNVLLDTSNNEDEDEDENVNSDRTPDRVQQHQQQLQREGSQHASQAAETTLTTTTTTIITTPSTQEGRRWVVWDECEVPPQPQPPQQQQRDMSIRSRSSLSTLTSCESAAGEAQRRAPSKDVPQAVSASHNAPSALQGQQRMMQQQMQGDRLWWLWNPIAHQSKEGTWWFLARVCRGCYAELMSSPTQASLPATATANITSTTGSTSKGPMAQAIERPLARLRSTTMGKEEDNEDEDDEDDDARVEDTVEEVEEDEEETPSLTSLFAAAWGALRRHVKSQSLQGSEADMGAISSTTTTTTNTNTATTAAGVNDAGEERNGTLGRKERRRKAAAAGGGTERGGKAVRQAVQDGDEVRKVACEPSQATVNAAAAAAATNSASLVARTARDLARITALARRERRVCVVLIDERGSARSEAQGITRTNEPQQQQQQLQLQWYSSTSTSGVERVNDEERPSAARPAPSSASPPQSSRVSGNSSFIMEVGGTLPLPLPPRQSPLGIDGSVNYSPERFANHPAARSRSRSRSSTSGVTLLSPLLPAYTDRHRSRYHTLHVLLNELQGGNSNIAVTGASNELVAGSAAMHSEAGMHQASSTSAPPRTPHELLSLLPGPRPQPRSPCLQAGGSVLLAAIEQQAAANKTRRPPSASPHASYSISSSSGPASELPGVAASTQNEGNNNNSNNNSTTLVHPMAARRLGYSGSTLQPGSASCSCGPSWAAECATVDHFGVAGHHRRSLQRRIVLNLPVKLCFPPPPPPLSAAQAEQEKTKSRPKMAPGAQDYTGHSSSPYMANGHTENVLAHMAAAGRQASVLHPTRMPLLSPPVSPMVARGKAGQTVRCSPCVPSATSAAARPSGHEAAVLPTPCQLPGAAMGHFVHASTTASEARCTQSPAQLSAVAARVELMGLVASAQDSLECASAAAAAVVNAANVFPFALFAGDAGGPGCVGPGSGAGVVAGAGGGSGGGAGGGPGGLVAAGTGVSHASSAAAAAMNSGAASGPGSAHLCPLLQQLTNVSVRTHAYLFVILRGESPSPRSQGEQPVPHSALDSLYDPSVPELVRPGLARRASATMQASLMRSAAYNIGGGVGASSSVASGAHFGTGGSSAACGCTGGAGVAGADLYARPAHRPFSGAELYHVYQHIQSCGGSVPPMAVLDIGPRLERRRHHHSNNNITTTSTGNVNAKEDSWDCSPTHHQAVDNSSNTVQASHNMPSSRLGCHEVWCTAEERTRRHSGGSMMDLARAHEAGAALAMNSVGQMARRLGLQYTRQHYPSQTNTGTTVATTTMKEGRCDKGNQSNSSSSHVCTDEEEALRSTSQFFASEEDCVSPLPSSSTTTTATTTIANATTQPSNTNTTSENLKKNSSVSYFQAALRGVVATLVQRDLRALQQCGE